MIRRAHVIGMGRLGRHLANRLEAIGITVHRWNRSPQSDAQPWADWAPGDADAVFLCVADDALQEVARQVTDRIAPTTWCIHHGGSVSKSVMGPRTRNAVLWPPMTFQPDEAPDWATLPMAVDADDPEFSTWARRLAPACFDVSESQRRHLHLGAVLLGNLTAAWIGTVQQHLGGLDLDPRLLSPLVEASVTKALDGEALDSVTGPAARNDRATLLAQQDLLSTSDPHLRELHALLTHRILTHHGHDPLPPLQAAPRRD